VFLKIILASQSPRRKQLLEWAEIPFEIIVKETDESFPDDLTMKEIAVHIALNKAKAVNTFLLNEGKNINNSTPVLAADTIVVIDDKVIGKPKDREDAINILQKLSGRKHEVITGVVILYKEKIIAFADVTEVTFHSLTNTQIEFYIDKYKPYDKAGAYAIQEWIGVIGIKSINGDFYNVMGLPVSKVLQALNELRNS
jgi:septum formation protein